MAGLFHQRGDAVLDVEAHGKLGFKLFLGDNLHAHELRNACKNNRKQSIYLASTSGAIVTSLEVMKFGVASADNADAFTWIRQYRGDVLKKK
jgi:hypothetical protein